MVKGCRLPGRRRVTGLAGGREASLHVVRVRRAIEVLDVARGAVRGNSCVVIADMTACAGDIHMRAGEREGRLAVVE